MPTIRTTPVVRVLLIISVVAFLAQMVADNFFGAHVFEMLGLVPYRVFHHFSYWQLVTYMFMHADMFHILFNMLVLWMIGSELESQWGSRFFTKYFFLCGMFGGILYLLVQFLFVKSGPTSLIPVVGSSGAIYGLLVAYGIIYSERIMLFMMVFPMKAKHFVMLLAGVEFVTTVFGSRTGVANLAHLGGMVAGFGYLAGIAWLRVRARRSEERGPKRARRKSSHLKLVINNEVIRDFDSDDDESGSDNGPGGPFSH